MKLLTFYQTTLFTEYLITLISYMHYQHYACVVVTRKHFSLNALLHTSQVDAHSPPCRCWYLNRWLCWM